MRLDPDLAERPPCIDFVLVGLVGPGGWQLVIGEVAARLIELANFDPEDRADMELPTGQRSAHHLFCRVEPADPAPAWIRLPGQGDYWSEIQRWNRVNTDPSGRRLTYLVKHHF